MKDMKHVAIFVVVGLALAFIFSGPLRNSPPPVPDGGTALKTRNVYAKGTIRLNSPSEQLDPPPFLFVIARAKGQVSGPPIAVRRYERVQFPFEFLLTQNDNMLGEDFFDGDIRIMVRLDADGVVGPKEKLDRDAFIEIAKEGNREVDIVLE